MLMREHGHFRPFGSFLKHPLEHVVVGFRSRLQGHLILGGRRERSLQGDGSGGNGGGGGDDSGAQPAVEAGGLR